MDTINENKNMRLKVCLLGDGGVGKTTWVTRHRTGEFTTKYIPTMGVEVHPIPYYTNKGMVTLDMWDIAGVNWLGGESGEGGLRDGYYIGADAFIVFFDVTSKLSFNNTSQWIAEAKKVNPKALIVLVGNKVDCKGRKVWPGWGSDTHYFDISARSNYNFEKPILEIVRHMLGDTTIHFVEEPPHTLVPPMICVEETEELELEDAMAELFSRFTTKEHFDKAALMLQIQLLSCLHPKVTERSKARQAKMNKE